MFKTTIFKYFFKVGQKQLQLKLLGKLSKESTNHTSAVGVQRETSNFIRIIHRMVILLYLLDSSSSTLVDFFFLSLRLSKTFQNFKFSSEDDDTTVSPSGDNDVFKILESCPGRSAILLRVGYDQMLK
jgi:hypothetical protein